MKQLTDDILMQFSQGEQAAFNAVFDAFRMRIFYFVRKVLNGNTPVAEEITSDTFVKLHRLHKNFNTYNNIQAFLFITARNACLDFLKYQQRQKKNLYALYSQSQQEELPAFEDTDIMSEVLQFIHAEIEKLPERSRLIIQLSLEGLSIKEIAEHMQISPQTVANQKTTALKSLRLKLVDKNLWLLVLYLLHRIPD